MLDNDQIEQDDLQDDVTDESEAVEAAEAEPEGELVITLEGVEPDDEPEPEDVGPKGQAALKALRAANKEAARRQKELERELAALKAPKVPEEETLGPRPTAADANFDDDKLIEMAIEWKAKSDRIEAQKNAALEKQKAAQEAFQGRVTEYQLAKKGLPVQNYDHAEAQVTAALPIPLQNVILRNLTGEEAAKVVYALGQSPKKLDELSKLDADQFAFALAKLSMGIKMERKPAQVETPLKGNIASPPPQSRDLAGLKKQAERTGDYTAYFKAKRDLGQ